MPKKANELTAKARNLSSRGHLQNREEQSLIWDYYKSRHTHAWNMLILSYFTLDEFTEFNEEYFKCEYMWENFIIRLWFYRTTIKTLTHIKFVSSEAKGIISAFDLCFKAGDHNSLKAIRDMIEHFDEYAMGNGFGPATRKSELDPWRKVSRDRFERGRFVLERAPAYNAAIALRSEAKRVSDIFIAWHKSSAES